jgi:hypothetical protein
MPSSSRVHAMSLDPFQGPYYDPLPQIAQSRQVARTLLHFAALR